MRGRYVSFSDESHTGHQFMVIGGISCKDETARILRDIVADAQGRFPDCMKWTSIRKPNLPRYIKLIDRVFDDIAEHKVDFHSLVVPKKHVDHATFNDGDQELGFNKFVIQHLYGFKRKLGREAMIRHMYAERASPHDQTKFASFLNGMARKHYGDQCNPCIGVDHVPFRDEKMLWIADILIGSIGSALNKENTYGSPKHIMAEHIRKLACLSSLSEETPPDKRHFKIWIFRPPNA